jgi:hypothetical protein
MSSVSPQTQIYSVFFDEKFAGMGVILFLTENISLSIYLSILYGPFHICLWQFGQNRVIEFNNRRIGQ